jgi:hypothetical protein
MNNTASPLLRRLAAALCFLLLLLGAACSATSPHRGRFPFSLADMPPRSGPEKMHIVAQCEAPGSAAAAAALAAIRPGDVVAFHMSHREAWSHLRRGGIQKIPYELFRYGHIALVVPNPQKPAGNKDLRLLQLAMKQAANTSDGLEYLKDKHWIVFRPPGVVHEKRLHEFTCRVIVSAGDAKRAYDYLGVLGIRNAPAKPQTLEDIGSKYSCATLVVAGLCYAGCDLRAIHRGGWFDIVTPAQVVKSGR